MPSRLTETFLGPKLTISRLLEPTCCAAGHQVLCGHWPRSIPGRLSEDEVLSLTHLFFSSPLEAYVQLKDPHLSTSTGIMQIRL